MVEGLLLTGGMVVGCALIFAMLLVLLLTVIGTLRPESRKFMTKQSEIIAGIVRKPKK